MPDDAGQTWRVLRVLLQLGFWIKALVAGAALVVFEWVAFHAFLIFTDPSAQALYSHKSGALLTSFAAKAMLINWVLGLCYAPLIVFGPGLSFAETRKLALAASSVNNTAHITYLIVGVMLAGFPLTLIPSYGMTEAALLVFLGILSYLAYRDIFERRDANLPAIVAAPRAAVVELSAGAL